MRILFLLLVALAVCGPCVGAELVLTSGPIILEGAPPSGDGMLPLVLFHIETDPTGTAYDVSLFVIDTGGHVSEPIDMALFANPVPAPVPEPMSVLMLACGLLVLMMPGRWLTRWSCLGERQSLLQRRP